VNAIATSYPATREAAAEAVYTFVHEAALPLAATAVGDNVTPAERRDGLADRYAASAVVLGGLAILRKSAPEHAEGYARFYLREAGRTPPSGSESSSSPFASWLLLRKPCIFGRSTFCQTESVAASADARARCSLIQYVW